MRWEKALKWYECEYKTYAISIFFAFIGWVFHAVFESLFIYQKPFVEILITGVQFNTAVIRIIISVVFFIFALFLSDSLYKRKLAEDELKKAHNELGVMNQELDIRVKEKTAEVEKLMRQKNELITQLSHDLRTPLTPLMTLLPMIAREEKDPKLKELLDTSIRNVDYLRDIVSKIIDLTRLDSIIMDFSFDDVDLIKEVENIIKDKEFVLEKNDIDVENMIGEKIIVKADKLRLREVFNHLISNSINHTSKDGGEITIDAKEENDIVVISVKDRGKGLSKKHQDYVFDEFCKADESRHDHNCTGLGLSICKRIVEKHGGKIWAESPGIGKGTTFYFTLKSSKNEVN